MLFLSDFLIKFIYTHSLIFILQFTDLFVFISISPVTLITL
jgi:hypothetical protein